MYYGAVDAYSDSGWAAAGDSGRRRSWIGGRYISYHALLGVTTAAAAAAVISGRSVPIPRYSLPPPASYNMPMLAQLPIALLGTPVDEEWHRVCLFPQVLLRRFTKPN